MTTVRRPDYNAASRQAPRRAPLPAVRKAHRSPLFPDQTHGTRFRAVAPIAGFRITINNHRREGTMRTETGLKLLALGVCAALSGTVLAAGDVEAGRAKAFTCMGCHGVPGYTNAYPTYRVPKLGGQHAQYTVAALTAYKNGQRSHATMRANADNLSEQDMEDIAAYFESRSE
jgi:cytochrome c553